VCYPFIFYQYLFHAALRYLNRELAEAMDLVFYKNRTLLTDKVSHLIFI
jgi:hypothetical protein